MLLNCKFDVMRATVRPAPLCASPFVRPSFQLPRKTLIRIQRTAVSSIAAAKIQLTAGGNYGDEFRPD